MFFQFSGVIEQEQNGPDEHELLYRPKVKWRGENALTQISTSRSHTLFRVELLAIFWVAWLCGTRVVAGVAVPVDLAA
jgi:hypothetical protein